MGNGLKPLNPCGLPPTLCASAYDLYKTVRAKYYVSANGESRLASIQYMSTACFKPEGWEARGESEDRLLKAAAGFEHTNDFRCFLLEQEQAYIDVHPEAPRTVLDFRAAGGIYRRFYRECLRNYRRAGISKQLDNLIDEEEQRQNINRATRRAKTSIFDIVMCNPELDTFCTFTYAPEAVDRFDYEACYALLRPWLSNRVQRADLRYVIVYEYHPSSRALHFHALMNSSALKLERARTPSGRAMSKDGKPIYNVRDWPFGFTTAQIIGDSETDHTKVSKYVFKYMGKGQVKIGGRYALHGGKLRMPVYLYGDSVEEFMPPDIRPCHTKEVKVLNGTVDYVEHSFI